MTAQQATSSTPSTAVVEFAGTPRAGKTTALQGLREVLACSGYRVAVVEEGAGFCPVADKLDAQFNVYTATSTITRILDAVHHDDDVVLVDRGLLDACCWIDWHRQSGQIGAADHETIDQFLRARVVADMISLVVLLTVDPIVALRRDGAPDAQRANGRIMNPRSLAAMNRSIDDVVARNRGDFRVVRFDTTRTDRDVTLARVVAAVSRHLDIAVHAAASVPAPLPLLAATAPV